MRRESLLVGCALIGTLTLFSGCRTAQKSNEKQILTKIESNADESASENKTSKQNVLGEPTGSMALSYAENFSVDYYGDYTLLKTKDGTQILTVPEDKDIPDNLDEDIVENAKKRLNKNKNRSINDVIDKLNKTLKEKLLPICSL